MAEQEPTQTKKEKNYSRWNQPKRILSKSEYKEYQGQLTEVKRGELRRQIETGRKNLEKFRRQESYRKSATGRIARGFEKAARYVKQPTQELYNRNELITSANIQRVQAQPRQTVLTPRQQYLIGQQIRQQREAQQQKNYASWCFCDFSSAGNNVPLQVEREVFNSQGGFASEGDKIGFQMSNLAAPSNPFTRLEQESNFHANNQHLKSVHSVDFDVGLFANLFP